MPMASGSNSDSLLVVDPQTGKWTTLRVPSPLGCYSRGQRPHRRSNGGWKGRALYANHGTHFVWHVEGGKGTKGKLAKFQMRPDPLAILGPKPEAHGPRPRPGYFAAFCVDGIVAVTGTPIGPTGM